MRGNLRAGVALAVGVAAISWSAIFVRWARMPGVASAFYRVLIAAAVLWPWVGRRGTAWRGVGPRTMLLAGLAGVFFAADVGCYNVAVLRTGAGTATFLGNNAPLVVGLVAWGLTKQRPSSRFGTALAVATAGAVLIVFRDLRARGGSAGGDVLAALASVSFALYLVVTERLRDGMDTAALMALSTSASAGALLGFALLTGTPLAIPGATAVWALLGLGLVCQVTGYFCLTYALGHVRVTVSSVVLLAVAPLSALLAWMLFGERMSGLQLAGGGLILAAVWWISVRDGETPGTVRNAVGEPRRAG